MNPYWDVPDRRVVFKNYSFRTRYKDMIDHFIARYSDCRGASTSVENTVIFDGICNREATQIKSMLEPFGCYTVVEYSDRAEPNAKQEELIAFLNRGNSCVRCLRCGSGRYVGDHGFFGTHPSRWRCRDCGWVWEY